MSGPQYESDTQELYNHLVGHLKGEPLTLSERFLNDGHRAFCSLLRKYMNPSQCRLMARAARDKLPTLKYQSKKGRFGLRDHMANLSECFSALETAGVTISEADKVLHLTQSILNDKLATGAVSHIVADNRLATSFSESVTHIMSTAAHLKIIGHESEGGNNRNRRNISKVNSQNQNRQRLENLARQYLDKKKWDELPQQDRQQITKIRRDKGIRVSPPGGGRDKRNGGPGNNRNRGGGNKK